GTLQSTLTDFRYLRKIWQQNTEEERLLGVSLTGIMDHDILNGTTEYEDPGQLERWLTALKEVAIETNKEWAKRLGIPQSTAITCVKPSGTVSQLVDSSSGIHPRFAKYYIRRVRADAKDPLARLMVDAGLPYEEAIGNPSTLVFSFPQKAPEGSLVVSDVSAMDQLKLWEVYQEYWCEHKPSCTVYYTDKEFLEVGQWVYNNFESVSGISFLPQSDHVYKQAPYEEITEQEYLDMVKQIPEIPWDKLTDYELEDTTTGIKELACTGTSCEWVDNT